MLFDSPEGGYSLHALNAIFLSSIDQWIRVDARGNKDGVDAQFSIKEEKLAFSINEDLGEKDYPHIYATPHPQTISTLKEHSNAITMYQDGLPESL
ncbi:hypothetical protein GGQ92_000024 [Gracilibacillus halotolerans]|uniref:Uncharacterized protein n=1 Tax=Gracilibacillus halotolerans TaxID=74386 RepID=A0A841RHC9_9BACI|nr:hypothetical protein [Gracilibacillus halotolerans]